MRTILRCALCAVAFIAVAIRGAAGQPASTQQDIRWLEGPATADLDTIAQVEIPKGFRFADRAGTKIFMELTHNVPGREIGVILPADAHWFITFEFNPVGYVKDDERNRIDADALIADIRSATERANAERRRRGWEAMEIVGWQQPPRYDAETHNLMWAIRGKSDRDEVVNYSVRLLGRGGVMEADLVLDRQHLAESMPQLRDVLQGFSFKAGQRYAEFRPGDKVAAYGLTALIAGGVGAAAAKSGLLAKLWKAIVVGVMALVAAIRRLFGKTFGKPDSSEPVPNPSR